VKIIAVLGISGVGKSTLVAKAAGQKGLLHLKASDLIKARLARPQSSEQLRQGPVLNNQARMLAEFANRIAATDHSARGLGSPSDDSPTVSGGISTASVISAGCRPSRIAQ
jgi:adenylate kinase